MSAAVVCKIIAAIVFLIVSSFGVALPFIYRNNMFYKKNQEILLTYIKLVVGGIFIGLVFFHLMPEVVQESEEHNFIINIAGVKMQASWIFICIGFLLTLTVVQLFHSHDHSHADTDSLLHSAQQKNNDIEYMSSNTPCCQEHASLSSHDEGIQLRSRTEKDSLSMFLIIASSVFFLSLHFIYDGIIVGSLKTPFSILIATAIMAGHKWAEGFALSVYMVNNNLNSWMFFLPAILFVFAAPLGILVAALSLTYSIGGVSLMLNAISIGAILAFGCETLQNTISRAAHSSKIRSWYLLPLSVFSGAAFMFGINLLENLFVEGGAEHSH